MFTLEQRKNFIEKTFEGETKISVKTYEGLTVNFCERINASFILRGLRNPADFEFEKAIAHTNRSLSDIETVFLLTSTETSFISSSIVREVIQNHGDYAHLVPKAVTIPKEDSRILPLYSRRHFQTSEEFLFPKSIPLAESLHSAVESA